jgi:putative oligomerization/nucleic acid binding protein
MSQKGYGEWVFSPFLLALVTWGISWLVFPFFANDQYRKSLLKDGYLPDDQIGHSPLKMDGSVADEIRKLAELKASGVLTDEEFSTRKSRLLGA